jgi:cell division septation protein DedD
VEVTPVTAPVAKPVKTPEVAQQPSKPVQAPTASAPAVKQIAATAEVVKAPPSVKRKESALQPYIRHDAKPHSGEKYLQIAAFGPRALDGFLRTLEGQGLHPVVAPGPVDNIYRILVGPFPNSAALEETRSLIKASGIEPILRAY